MPRKVSQNKKIKNGLKELESKSKCFEREKNFRLQKIIPHKDVL